MKYYDVSHIKSIGAYYNIIFGGRSNGKSTSVCKMLIDEFKEHGKCFGRVLRYALDCRADLMEDWFRSDYLRQYVAERWNQQIRFNGRTWFFTSLDAEDPYSKKNEREVFGEVFFLASEQRYKSAQFDHIKYLIMEEFTLLNAGDYMPYEWEHFKSLISTINRHRDDLTVWLIGNTLSKSNPYFVGLGININKLNIFPGQLRILQNEFGTTYAIEYAEMSYTEQEEVPQILRISGNEIAIEGGFESDPNVYNEETLARFLKKADPQYICNLIYKKKLYGLYRIRITPKQAGFCILKNWEKIGRQRKEFITVRLDNRLIEIDKETGKTLQYLHDINFDTRLCIYDDEEIKYITINALKMY